MARTRDLPAGYPHDPVTIGEHIRKARIDRGLTRREVATLFGVHPDTVRWWETSRSRPFIALMPRVLAFLGYDPHPPAGSLWDQIRAKRRRLGLSERDLERVLGMARTTWLRGERGEIGTSEESLRRLREFLEWPEDPTPP